MHNTHQTSEWRSLLRIGGIAALLAGILFRRNWAAELTLFGAQEAPVTVEGWFTMLQDQRLVGMVYLNTIDLVNYVLVALMFLALYVVLRRSSKDLTTVAALLGFIGVTVFLASNTAFSMLALSNQYALSISDTRRESLIAAGQAMLAMNRFGMPGSHPGAGGYMSLLLIAIAETLFGVVMLRGDTFKRFTAWVGIAAGTLDLMYCVLFAFIPVLESDFLAVLFIPLAGLCLMVWHILVGRQLLKLR